jgi:hypothetical protein
MSSAGMVGLVRLRPIYLQLVVSSIRLRRRLSTISCFVDSSSTTANCDLCCSVVVSSVSLLVRCRLVRLLPASVWSDCFRLVVFVSVCLVCVCLCVCACPAFLVLRTCHSRTKYSTSVLKLSLLSFTLRNVPLDAPYQTRRRYGPKRRQCASRHECQYGVTKSPFPPNQNADRLGIRPRSAPDPATA